MTLQIVAYAAPVRYDAEVQPAPPGRTTIDRTVELALRGGGEGLLARRGSHLEALGPDARMSWLRGHLSLLAAGSAAMDQRLPEVALPRSIVDLGRLGPASVRGARRDDLDVYIITASHGLAPDQQEELIRAIRARLTQAAVDVPALVVAHVGHEPAQSAARTHWSACTAFPAARINHATTQFLNGLETHMGRVQTAAMGAGNIAFPEALDLFLEDFDYGRLSSERRAGAGNVGQQAGGYAAGTAAEAIEALRRTLGGVRDAVAHGLQPQRAYDCLCSAAELVRTQLGTVQSQPAAASYQVIAMFGRPDGSTWPFAIPSDIQVPTTETSLAAAGKFWTELDTRLHQASAADTVTEAAAQLTALHTSLTDEGGELRKMLDAAKTATSGQNRAIDVLCGLVSEELAQTVAAQASALSGGRTSVWTALGVIHHAATQMELACAMYAALLRGESPDEARFRLGTETLANRFERMSVRGVDPAYVQELSASSAQAVLATRIIRSN